MSSGQIGLILEYVTSEIGNIPQANVHWIDGDEVAECLEEIIKRRKLTCMEELDEIVDLVQTDGQMEEASEYLEEDCSSFAPEED